MLILCNLVQPFTSHIEWSGIVKLETNISCTLKDIAPPGSINLNVQFSRFIQLNTFTPLEIYIPQTNKIVNLFYKGLEVGNMVFLCSASLVDLNDNFTKYTLYSYAYINFTLYGMNNLNLILLFFIKNTFSHFFTIINKLFSFLFNV